MYKPEVGHVVRTALENARKAGLSVPKQTEHAIRALLQVEPDMSNEQAADAVRKVRQFEQDEAGTC